MKAFFGQKTPIAMAHRGSRLLWPENTMIAFQGAVDLGIRYLETDLHASADGVLVCLHDDTLERTTDAAGRVVHRTAAELARVDAGFRHDPLGGFPFRGKGIGVPTLEEVVTAFPDTHLTLDLKQSNIEHLLVEAIDRHNLTDRVIVGSFRDRRIFRGRTTVVDARFVRAAHERNKQVHVWTINEPDEMRYLLDLGVDALISDRPDVALQVMNDHSG
jgi:glycerophosphoryl diester phosphodiesterase